MSKQLPQAAFDLLQARALIDAHGWCRGSLSNGRGYCVIGALLQVTSQGETGKRLSRAIEPIMLELESRNIQSSMGVMGSGTQDVMNWNDLYCRSKKQAMDLLNKAACRLMDG
jgi:hypothetical protein